MDTSPPSDPAPFSDVAVPAGSEFDGLVVEDAPNAMLASIVSSFVRSHAPEGTMHRVARAVRAAVAFDAWVAPPATAFRTSPLVAGPRHLVYRIANHDGSIGAQEAGGDATEIAVSIYATADGDVIVGHVLTDAGSAGPEALVVEVMSGPDVVAVADVGARGEFSVSLAGGWTELVVVAADRDICLAAPDAIGGPA